MDDGGLLPGQLDIAQVQVQVQCSAVQQERPVCSRH
jgi:hypothetical protein